MPLANQMPEPSSVAERAQNSKYCKCCNAPCKHSLSFAIRPISGSDGNMQGMLFCSVSICTLPLLPRMAAFEWRWRSGCRGQDLASGGHHWSHPLLHPSPPTQNSTRTGRLTAGAGNALRHFYDNSAGGILVQPALHLMGLEATASGHKPKSPIASMQHCWVDATYVALMWGCQAALPRWH